MGLDQKADVVFLGISVSLAPVRSTWLCCAHETQCLHASMITFDPCFRRLCCTCLAEIKVARYAATPASPLKKGR